MDTDECMISQKVVPTSEGASAIVADKIQQVEIYIYIYIYIRKNTVKLANSL